MAQIHQFPYAHGDILPECVFWYQQATGSGSGNAPSLGRLKILSFGDTRLVENSHDSRRAARGDIWALGCVYLEFMAWYILGLDGVDTAENDAVNGRDFFASLSRMRAIEIPADGLTPSIEANKAVSFPTHPTRQLKRLWLT
ncbi:hypothetical protein GE09DRAFT_1090381 [Coniochaeta sp. 2T2.1]|nr:hypothetical protein GE09DRAFT_1090381 [Coniochaeta sp. 2T2.1]